MFLLTRQHMVGRRPSRWRTHVYELALYYSPGANCLQIDRDYSRGLEDEG